MALPTTIIVLFLAYCRPFRLITVFIISHSSLLFFFAILTSSILRSSMTRSFHRCLRPSPQSTSIRYPLRYCPYTLTLCSPYVSDSSYTVASSMFELISYPSLSLFSLVQIFFAIISFLKSLMSDLSDLANIYRVQSWFCFFR